MKRYPDSRHNGLSFSSYLIALLELADLSLGVNFTVESIGSTFYVELQPVVGLEIDPCFNYVWKFYIC